MQYIYSVTSIIRVCIIIESVRTTLEARWVEIASFCPVGDTIGSETEKSATRESC